MRRGPWAHTSTVVELHGFRLDWTEERDMPDAMYPQPAREIAQKRRDLAPEAQAAFDAFSRTVFKDGVLSAKMKQIPAVAVAHVTQCPYCIRATPGQRCAPARPRRSR